MRITEELRKWISTVTWLDDGMSHSHKDILAIADCIDEEHQKAMPRAGQLLEGAEEERDRNYANWQECKQKVLQGNITIDELNARIECLEDELSHRIEPLKDADDVPIHLGDMMHGTCPSGKYVCGEVSAIGDNKFWLCNVQFSLRPDYMRHYHKPTVEELLREFVSEFNRDDTELCDEEIIERFAAKLRLADDREEQ